MPNNDQIYEAYMGNMGEDFKYETRKRIEWILEQVGDAKSVLDLGCSQGVVSLLLAQNGKSVTGVDIQPEAIEYAKDLQEKKIFENAENACFLCSDIMDLNFEQKFDCIIITEVIEHIENPQDIIDQAKSFLKEDGLFIISVPFGVSKHPDHKATYYLGNFLRLICPYFYVKQIEFMGTWFGAICSKNETEQDINALISLHEEKYEDELSKRENLYLNKLQELREKHKKAVDDYYTIKNWLSEKDAKVNALEAEKKELQSKCQKAVNDYYTAKGWFEDKKKELEDIKNEFDGCQAWANQKIKDLEIESQKKDEVYLADKKKLQEQHKKAVDDYYTIKQWFEDKIASVDTLKAHEEEMIEMISKYVLQEQETQAVLKSAKSTIQKQKKEIQVYKGEIENYKRIMNKIENTWYGKIALKCYRLLRKLRFIG